MVEVTTSSVSPLSNSPLSRFEKNRQARSQRQIFLQRLRANRLAVVGAVIIGILIFFAIFGPLVAPENPIAMNLVNQFQPPSLAHPFGTDDFGRDILSRVIYGARLSITTGALVVLVSTVAGCALGLAAGSVRWLDDVLGRVTDALMAFPDILL